ncbi:MAG: GNAT family N-acetyltransferase [Kofleriaceae bacterium]
MLPAWPSSAIEDELFAMPRRAFVALADLRVIERPGWLQIVTPSFKRGGFNGVSFCALDEAGVDAAIDAAIAEYHALGIQFRWTVTPDCRPADLAERLARRGLARSWSCGLARSTANLPDAPSEVRVEEVDHATIDAYTRVMAEGWQDDPAPLAVAHAAVLAEPARRHRLYLAYCDGEPAAAASYVAFPRSAYLLGAVALPQFRRRGLYRALVIARLRAAAARGLELAISHAREETSAPVLERMGFERIARWPVFFG